MEADDEDDTAIALASGDSLHTLNYSKFVCMLY